MLCNHQTSSSNHEKEQPSETESEDEEHEEMVIKKPSQHEDEEQHQKPEEEHTNTNNELALLNESSAASINPNTSKTLLEWLSTFKEWNTKTKVNALEQILELCEHAHIKHVHNYIEPRLQRDYISEMPKELLLHMLTYLRPRDLYKLAQVSSYWHQIANDSILWKNICKRARVKLDVNPSPLPTSSECCDYHRSISYSSSGETEPSADNNNNNELDNSDAESDVLVVETTAAKKRKQTSSKSRAIKSSKMKRMSSTMSPSSLSSSASCSPTIPDASVRKCAPVLSQPRCVLNTFNPYKRAYLIDYNVTNNWCTRPLPRPIMLKSHDEHVITCLKFDGRRVVSGSDDNTLKVWCAQTGKLLQTLTGKLIISFIFNFIMCN